MNKLSTIQALFKSPVALKSIIDEIPMGILLLDPQRRIITLNRALEALTGFYREEAAGIGCHHILRSRICFKECPLLKMDKHSEPVSYQSDIINKDRQRIPIRVTMAPVIDLKGDIAGYLGQ